VNEQLIGLCSRDRLPAICPGFLFVTALYADRKKLSAETRCGPAMLCAGALPDMAPGCLVTTILRNGADGVNRLAQGAYTSENEDAGKTENRSSEAFFP